MGRLLCRANAEKLREKVAEVEKNAEKSSTFGKIRTLFRCNCTRRKKESSKFKAKKNLLSTKTSNSRDIFSDSSAFVLLRDPGFGTQSGPVIDDMSTVNTVNNSKSPTIEPGSTNHIKTDDDMKPSIISEEKAMTTVMSTSQALIPKSKSSRKKKIRANSDIPISEFSSASGSGSVSVPLSLNLATVRSKPTPIKTEPTSSENLESELQPVLKESSEKSQSSFVNNVTPGQNLPQRKKKQKGGGAAQQNSLTGNQKKDSNMSKHVEASELLQETAPDNLSTTNSVTGKNSSNPNVVLNLSDKVELNPELFLRTTCTESSSYSPLNLACYDTNYNMMNHEGFLINSCHTSTTACGSSTSVKLGTVTDEETVTTNEENVSNELDNVMQVLDALNSRSNLGQEEEEEEQTEDESKNLSNQIHKESESSTVSLTVTSKIHSNLRKVSSDSDLLGLKPRPRMWSSDNDEENSAAAIDSGPSTNCPTPNAFEDDSCNHLFRSASLPYDPRCGGPGPPASSAAHNHNGPNSQYDVQQINNAIAQLASTQAQLQMQQQMLQQMMSNGGGGPNQNGGSPLNGG